MKLLGIDYGSKYLGLAYTDSANGVVIPLKTINTVPEDKAIADIMAIVKDRDIGKLVIGLPLNFKMEETEMSVAIREFAGYLVKETGVETIFVNEVLTTDLSKRMTTGRGKDDAVAAQIILSDYLLKYHKH